LLAPALSSCAVWIVWGARQNYCQVFFVEADVLVPCSWGTFIGKLLHAIPTAAAAESLLLPRCYSHDMGKWQHGIKADCNVCANVTRSCHLAYAAITNGLLRAADAVLREGEVLAHHEVFIPELCMHRLHGVSRAAAALGRCNLVTAGLAGIPHFVDATSPHQPSHTMRIVRDTAVQIEKRNCSPGTDPAVVASRRAMYRAFGCSNSKNDALLQAQALDERALAVFPLDVRKTLFVFHPAKCPRG